MVTASFCRRALLLLITAVLFLLPACGAPTLPYPDLPPGTRPVLRERTAAAVVLVRLHAPELPPSIANTYTACGGVAIGPRSILTAAHCVLVGDPRLEVVQETVLFQTREQFRRGAGVTAATVRYLDTTRDVALLRTNEHVFAAYAPLRQVTAADMTVEVIREFKVTVADSPMPGLLRTAIEKGDSGSPVFGLDGAVIGIVKACYFKPFESDACVPELGGVYTVAMP